MDIDQNGVLDFNEFQVMWDMINNKKYKIKADQPKLSSPPKFKRKTRNESNRMGTH